MTLTVALGFYSVLIFDSVVNCYCTRSTGLDNYKAPCAPKEKSGQHPKNCPPDFRWRLPMSRKLTDL